MRVLSINGPGSKRLSITFALKKWTGKGSPTRLLQFGVLEMKVVFLSNGGTSDALIARKAELLIAGATTHSMVLLYD
jgi:hypothetical protein